jgi:hypothetical protein
MHGLCGQQLRLGGETWRVADDQGLQGAAGLRERLHGVIVCCRQNNVREWLDPHCHANTAPLISSSSVLSWNATRPGHDDNARRTASEW